MYVCFWNICRTKEIEFTVPQSLSPLTPTFGRKGVTSGDSSPASLSGSRSETEHSTSRANTPSPIFFRGAVGGDTGGKRSLYDVNVTSNIYNRSGMPPSCWYVICRNFLITLWKGIQTIEYEKCWPKAYLFSDFFVLQGRPIRSHKNF